MFRLLHIRVYFWENKNFLKVSPPICPVDTVDKLSSEREKVSKGRKCPYLPLKMKTLLFFSRRVSLPLFQPDSSEAARRRTIDSLAHKMDFVIFKVNL